MLHSSDAEDWLKTGLCEAILVLCKSGLKFQSQFSVNGLLAITVDQSEVLLINIKETVSHSPEPLASETFEHRQSETTTSYTTTNNSSQRFNSNSKKIYPKRKRVGKLIKEHQGLRENFDTNGNDQHSPQIVNNNLTSTNNNDCNDYNNDDEESSQRYYIKKDITSVNRSSNDDKSDNDNDENAVVNKNDHLDDNKDDLEFDLSIVKVEKDGDACTSSENFFQQTFQGEGHLQLYNDDWLPQNVPSSFPPIKSGRSRSRRSPYSNNGVYNIADQKQCLLLEGTTANRITSHHSSQRRTAREGCCENCGTRNTTAWRRSDLKELLCNACGCYYKLHKYHRPLHMAHNEIKTRCRRSKQPDAQMLRSLSDPANQHLLGGAELLSANQHLLGGAELLPASQNQLLSQTLMQEFSIAQNANPSPDWSIKNKTER